MQLIAGKSGQEYNKRKNRKGAFWEDRYHATAIETDHHLAQCIVYIDLNMIRAGEVRHPEDWITNGYNEIQNPKQRYKIIDLENLISLFNFTDLNEFQKQHNEWVIESIPKVISVRESMWSESIAVGSKLFVNKILINLKQEIKKRKAVEKDGSYFIREPAIAYNTHFDPKKDVLSAENKFLWDVGT